ncbi:hypothetical protein Bca52824_026380 [Brassica carinata]|uniref:DUF4283 domain-containing protein n=1 Tax=Brassica carinata TaxID=52824 RepID=A0A8X7V919_BRACI|nr:hypothetical protein Bca52824_026380 [Brassica carinata]
MSQSQLLGSSGDKENGAGGRKRLKISLPHFNNSDLIKGYSKTLIGRCMNPPEQNINYLLVTMPKIWNLEEKVVGTDLGLGRFQFDFDEEADIDAVLKMQHFHFDYWMLSLVPWQPRKSKNYPFEITFWIKVLGVPLQFWEEPTFRSIGDALGETKAVDLDNGRVQVVVDGFKEMIFETSVDFTGGEYYEGEEVSVTLKYEKLFGYCETCFSLCHKKEKCPLNMKSPEKTKETRNGNEGRYDDRARSYKGVLINGNGEQLDKKRELREYHGKGKGKMFEEDGSKWVRAAEREKKKYHSTRRDYRGDEEGSRYRNIKREHARGEDIRVDTSKETREEGEIRDVVKSHQLKENSGPSSSFLAELLETQEEAPKVNSKPLNKNQEVDTALVGLEESLMVDAENDIVLEVTGADNFEHGNKDNVENDFQSLSDGETEEDVRMLDVMTGDLEGEKVVEGKEGKDRVAGDVARRNGPRKKPLKQVTGAGASNKMKMAQIMTSKRPAAKPGIRYGDYSKQVEDKGTSNPKYEPAKN